MTNQEILQIALAQSARELNCAPEDLLRTEPVLSPLRLGPEARKYYKPATAGLLVSYGSNAAASVREDLGELVGEFKIGRAHV